MPLPGFKQILDGSLAAKKAYKGGIEADMWQVIDPYLLKPHMILLETAAEKSRPFSE